MRRRIAGAALAGVVLGALLAGCAADSEAVPTGDPSQAPLRAGKGAIAGLLVDDRFRPIALGERADGDGQAQGFVLLVETGQRTGTTANGEFAFLDLEPGRYTLRVRVDGHEAPPMAVQVAPDVHNEVNVIARRVASTEGTVIITEFSVFISCYFAFIVNGLLYDCTLDQSGDSNRSWFEADYTAHDNASWLITEMRSNTDKGLEVQVRGFDCDDDAGTFAVARGPGDYIRVQNQHGVVNEEHNGQLINKPWSNDCQLRTYLFGDAYPRELLWEAWPENPGSPAWFNPIIAGLDVYMGVKAQFLQSFFIGEPEAPIDQYCLLC